MPVNRVRRVVLCHMIVRVCVDERRAQSRALDGKRDAQCDELTDHQGPPLTASIPQPTTEWSPRHASSAERFGAQGAENWKMRHDGSFQVPRVVQAGYWPSLDVLAGSRQSRRRYPMLEEFQ